MTACVVRERDLRGGFSPPVLSGLIIDFHDGGSTLLGRCTDFGESFDLEEGDHVQQVIIGQATTKSRTVEAVFFITARGLNRGFSGDKLVDQEEVDLIRTTLVSKNGLTLTGIAWSYDLGHSSSGDDGIQPIYSQATHIDRSELLSTLYPSIDWLQAPASHVQLRPIPSVKASRYAFTTTQLPTDEENIYPDTDITSIRVYFNAFLQGVQIAYANGEQRSLGNLVGADTVFGLCQERIFTVETEHDVQTMPGPGFEPRDTVFVNRIRVNDLACYLLLRGS